MWNEFKEKYGDTGRNLVWILSHEKGRMKLREIGERSGVSYPVVASGIQKIKMSAPRKACRLLRVEVPHEQSLASSSSPKVHG